ncbi:CGNR zinc finger domain-containing protein [Rhodococcus sp. IEGM 1330]|uniref:CGNR zinc finger domain-containing protein n=1 Tax=Rhodococcus sp. IEGM 1330 TaxID=3082225 RepID=UPI0029535409|nr:CGNR zinc finger domain-containing protein [Rhodococcus sp. IEGM 1330]MDV8024370.1 CGNR zinc finger domain-containing protein [Rhodococcus sp. IEGM 1330]
MTVHRPAAELAVEIVNAWKSQALDPEWVAELLARELLPVRHRGVVGPADIVDAQAVLEQFAQKVSPVFEVGDSRSAADALNRVLASVDVRVTVSVSDDFAPHLHYDGTSAVIAERLRVNCLVALATVVADPSGALRLGVCDSCRNAFVDFSRSARQRFCTRRCATRVHVRQHRKRVS